MQLRCELAHRRQLLAWKKITALQGRFNAGSDLPSGPATNLITY